MRGVRGQLQAPQKDRSRSSREAGSCFIVAYPTTAPKPSAASATGTVTGLAGAARTACAACAAVGPAIVGMGIEES